MANKKKLQLGPIQANKLIAGIPEERETIKAQVQLRHDILEFQELVTKANSIDYKVLND